MEGEIDRCLEREREGKGDLEGIVESVIQ